MSDTPRQPLPGAPTGRQKAALQTGPGLQFRDALSDWDHVPSRIYAEGRDRTQPLVTIAITTFRRSALLVEAIGSALRQRFDRPYEIIVLDNDPASHGAAALMAAVPELAERAFRYFVNDQNLGVFGNFNRCIQVAQGEWLTILNDDDLLDDDYLALMFEEIDRNPRIDGIASGKRYVDTAGINAGNAGPSGSELINARVFINSLKSPAGLRSLARRVVGRARVERNYLFQAARRIRPGKFFWGAMLGNGGGFLFRRSTAIAVGGFYPEEYPSADFWFYARFAKKGELRQHRRAAATISKTPGSITLNSVAEQLKLGSALQRALVGTETPRWWGLLLPAVLAHARVYFIEDWGVDIPSEQLSRELGIQVPPKRQWYHNPARFLLGGE